MSPRRGDRVTVPPPEGRWDVRFATSDAATGWEELCRHALANTRRCLETLQTEPQSAANPDRQHRLRGDLAIHRHNGKDLEQWEYAQAPQRHRTVANKLPASLPAGRDRVG